MPPPRSSDRRRRRRSTSSSPSSRSSDASERARRRRRRLEGGKTKWGMMETPEIGMAPPAEAIGDRRVKGGVKFLVAAADPVAAAAARQAAVEEPGNLSGATAKVALMHKLQQNKSGVLGGRMPLNPSSSSSPSPASSVAKDTPKELLNPLLAGPPPSRKKPAQRADDTPAKNSFVKRTLVLDVARPRCGLLIGKQGKNHAALSEKYQCQIQIPGMDSPPEMKVTVKGSAAGVEGVRREFELILQCRLPVVSDTTAGSRVICLANMVADPADVDEDLVASVKEECEKCGPVTNILVYDEKQPDATIDSKLLIQFQYPQSASRAMQIMDGRYFDERRIRCDFFCEDAFMQIFTS